MRATLPPEVESQRLGGEPGCGCMGAWQLVCPETGRRLAVIASDGRDWQSENLPPPAWEHVSVSSPFGCPTWKEMCWVKGVFWNPDECVIEYHPPQSDYVNIHPNVLHLWKPVGVVIPMPPKATV